MTAPVDATAALERGRPVLIVCPPTPECAGALWPLAAGSSPVLIVTESPSAALAWSSVVPQPLRFHAVTGLERSARILADGVDVIAGAPADLTALLTKSALKVDGIRTVVLAWPESLGASPEFAAVGSLLAELKEARRIVLSWNPGAIESLLDAYAHRPHVVGDLPVGEDARPLPPVCAARYVIAGGARDAAIVAALDALDPGSSLVWRRGAGLTGTAGIVLCADLPTRAELNDVSAAGNPVLVLAPEQLPYARTIASPLTPVPMASAGGGPARQARAAIAARLERGDLAPELALLAPLFERYDAAEVAAAAYAVGREAGSGKRETGHLPAARVKIHVNVGKKDRAAAKDIVGALIREVGLSKDDIGRIDVKEMHSMVEVAEPAAERAVARLSGLMIRGRRVNARLER